MAKTKSVALTPDQQAALGKASRHGKSHSFRQRCLMVLLKSECRTSRDVAAPIGCCEVVVNTWMKRYQQQGMDGLKTKAGRGRKSILQAEADLVAVRRAVQSSRQRSRAEQPSAHLSRQSRASAGVRQRVLAAHTQAVPEKNGCRFKRIRRRVRGVPNADVYALKREALAEFEALSEQGHIDLLYGDESRVSLLPCVPYGWQFADEQAAMPTQRGGGVNCFALLSRRNECQPHFTEGKVTAAWIGERLDALSLSVRRPTVIVLDNASVHRKAVRERGHIQRARPHLAGAGPVRVLPADVLAAPEHRGGALAQTEV